MVQSFRARRARTAKSAKSVLALATTISSLAGRAVGQNTWEVVGESGVSAQQLFLNGANGKVHILDKVENNPITVNGHPAWATYYDSATNKYDIKDVTTNTFCAGGNWLGNGTMGVFGGNKAVTYGGRDGVSGQGPYQSINGGTAIRLLEPCDDDCEWTTSQQANMQAERWYPTVETLQDGSLAILGGMRDGGYVNAPYADNPTIEYFPTKGDQLGLNILAETLPCNLYPLTWLLPSGDLFIQSNLGAAIFDWQNNVEHPLPNIPHAVRVYPASGATTILPLTPANNWTATMLFCGGTDLQPDQWMTNPNWNVAAFPTDDTCVSITPDVSSEWQEEDKMFEGRSMGQFIILPDGRLFHLNGVATGTAGYGNTSWAIGQSYGDGPILKTAYYDPAQAAGSRWSRPSDMQEMTVPRLYHSSATLMPDGSVFNSGSNPNADYIPSSGFVDEKGLRYPYHTEYRVEVFKPDYFDKKRPAPSGLPKKLTYGGDAWSFKLSRDDLGGDEKNVDTVKVVVMRTGYSTHAMNMGMRYVQLNSTWELSSDGSATIHSEQMPPNPSIMAPGPALLYIVVNGVPSIATDVMVGDGIIGNHAIQARATLPGTLAQSGAVISSSGKTSGGNTTSNGGSSSSSNNGSNTSAASSAVVVSTSALALVAGLAALSLA